MVSIFLEPVDDGLRLREASDHTRDKLETQKKYIEMFLQATKNDPWRAWNYIDLQAGPGKVEIRKPREIVFGSPLIALNAPRSFTNYWLVDLDTENINALEHRTAQSERSSKVKIICGDCNIVVDGIVEKIKAMDNVYRAGIWSSLNLAFLDPEGLELGWSTVEKLASVNRMDLIINFSTSGFTRNVRRALESGNTETIDRFFGTVEWKEVYCSVRHEDVSRVRRVMIDFYKGRLADLGYIHIIDELARDELVVKNSKSVQQYTLFVASKHELGSKFGKVAVSNVRGQKRLPLMS